MERKNKQNYFNLNKGAGHFYVLLTAVSLSASATSEWRKLLNEYRDGRKHNLAKDRVACTIRVGPT